MPRRSEILNPLNSDLFSLEVYPDGFFEPYEATREFTKWAAVPVPNFNEIPQGMHSLLVPAGQYAVFTHKGLQTEAERTYTYIFLEWLPNSGFALQNRPHFAIMGQAYNRFSAQSEEDIFIPIGPKLPVT